MRSALCKYSFRGFTVEGIQVESGNPYLQPNHPPQKAAPFRQSVACIEAMSVLSSIFGV
jgi:hypothetical protein